MSRRSALVRLTRRQLAEALDLDPDVMLAAVYERRELDVVELVVIAPHLDRVAELCEAPVVQLSEVTAEVLDP